MNLPNLITLFRIILTPIFMFVLITKYHFKILHLGIYSVSYGTLLAVVIFAIAGISDFFDGFLARKYKIVTKLGQLLDPLADKLLVSSALLSLVEMHKIPSWIAFVIIAREFAVTGLRLIAASEGTIIAASKWGKAKTISQFVALILIIINNFPFVYFHMDIAAVLLYVALVLTIISGIEYFFKNRQVFKPKKKNKKTKERLLVFKHTNKKDKKGKLLKEIEDMSDDDIENLLDELSD